MCLARNADELEMVLSCTRKATHGDAEDGADKGCHYDPANMCKLAGVRLTIPLSRECVHVAASAEAQDDAESTPFAVTLSLFLHSSSKYVRSPPVPFASFDGAGGQDALSSSTLSLITMCFTGVKGLGGVVGAESDEGLVEEVVGRYPTETHARGEHFRKTVERTEINLMVDGHTWNGD